MLTIINQELFDVSKIKKDEETGACEIDFFTSEKINQDIPADRKKQFVKLKTPTADYSNYKHIVSVRENEYKKRSVLIRATEEARRDANIILVAFPFNGLIKPIAPSKNFRIYKGIIASSDTYNIQHEGFSYKKILYFVIEPNMILFDNDEDLAKIPIEFVAVSYNKKDNERVTMSHTLEILISRDGTVVYDTKIEEIEPIDMSQYKGMKLYQQFEIKPRTNKPQNRDNYTKDKTPLDKTKKSADVKVTKDSRVNRKNNTKGNKNSKNKFK